MTRDFAAEIARCDAEIAACRAQSPNFGATLGEIDWLTERAFIEAEAAEC